MASTSDASNNISSTGSHSAGSGSTLNDGKSKSDNVTENMKCGWLTKRTKLSHKWERRWFLLKSNMLHYGNDSESLDKHISLDCTEIAEADIDNKRYVFRLKPNQSRRTYYLHASSKEELQDWMQAICFAKAASHHGDSSQACSIQ